MVYERTYKSIHSSIQSVLIKNESLVFFLVDPTTLEQLDTRQHPKFQRNIL